MSFAKPAIVEYLTVTGSTRVSPILHNCDDMASPYNRLLNDIESFIEASEVNEDDNSNKNFGWIVGIPSKLSIQSIRKSLECLYSDFEIIPTHGLYSVALQFDRRTKMPQYINIENFQFRIMNMTNETPSTSLWVSHVQKELGHDELHHLFSIFGQIESIRIIPKKNCAFINYISKRNATNARMIMNSFIAMDLPLKIEFAKSVSW